MRICKVSLFMLVILIGSACSRAADTDQGWREQLEKWRAQQAAALSAPDGWLSLVGLEWLKPGDNSIGTAPDSTVRLPGSGNAHFAVFQVNGNNVQMKAPPGGFPPEFRVDGHPAKEQAVAFEQNPPTVFTAGTLTFFVIQRGDHKLLRVKDSQSPTRVNFKGLHWYPPDPHYRIEAEWVPLATPKIDVIHSIIGTSTKASILGVAKFTLHGETIELEPLTEGENEKILLFVIRDRTSGKTTYANARFLYTDFPDHGLHAPGKLVLDFNRLENPPCAYTPYATCPLPPESNRLKVPILAGELRYSDRKE